jgi:hypothetical protein
VFFWNAKLLWLNLQGAYVISRVKAERSVELNPIEPLRSVEVTDLNSGKEGFKLTMAPFVATIDDKWSMSFTPF